MKDDPDGVAQAGAYPADAVTEVDPVAAFRPLDWSIVDGECDGIALP